MLSLQSKHSLSTFFPRFFLVSSSNFQASLFFFFLLHPFIFYFLLVTVLVKHLMSWQVPCNYNLWKNLSLNSKTIDIICQSWKSWDKINYNRHLMTLLSTKDKIWVLKLIKNLNFITIWDPLFNEISSSLYILYFSNCVNLT